MPFDGSGIFNRLYDFTQDRDDGIRILASRMDGEFDNIVNAFNTQRPATNITYNGSDLKTVLDSTVADVARLRNLAINGINLLYHGLENIAAIRNDGTDADGSNAVAVQAVFDYCAPRLLPIRIPYNARIGLKVGIYIRDYQIILGEYGHEFISVAPGNVFRTSIAATGVYIDCLRWRSISGAGGVHFAGTYNQSLLSDLEHLGNVDTGGAYSVRLNYTTVYRPKCRNMPASGGNAGFRTLSATYSRVIDPDIESGDDALQMVPPAGQLGNVFNNFYYIGGRGVSLFARGGIISTGPTTNTQLKNVGIIGKTYLRGGGWTLSIGAKSNRSYGIVGGVSSAIGRFAFRSLNRSGALPIQLTENVIITSPSTPAISITGVISSSGLNLVVGQTLVMSATLATITCSTAGAFTNFVVGDYITLYDGSGLNGPNDKFLAKILSRTDNVLGLDTAPVSETSINYTLTDKNNFKFSTPGQANVTLPADAIVRRTTLIEIENVDIDAVCDDATGIRQTCISLSGLIIGAQILARVTNLRVHAITAKDAGPTPSGNVVRIFTDAPPTAPIATHATIRVQNVTGGYYELNGYAAPIQPAGITVSGRTTDQFDDDGDDPSAAVSPTTVPGGVTVGGVIQNLSALQPAVLISDLSTRITVKGLQPIAASSTITNAKAVKTTTAGITAQITASDVFGIQTGNNQTNMLDVFAGSTLKVCDDNFGIT